MAPSATQSVGAEKEAQALAWLCAQGLLPVTRNFRCRFGEIDLVMLDGDCLVFVEVRFRSSNHYYSAAESVGPAKQRKLIVSAQLFLKSERRFRDRCCRFDVIAIDRLHPQQSAIQWIKDAFRPGEQ